jgi:CHAD domain-containing protein
VAGPEREVKLTVASSFAMPGLEGLGDGVVAVHRDPQDVWTVYFDTDDLRLARWGASLRHRLGQGWTVKLPPERDGDVLVRPELTFAGHGKRPPAAAVDLVRAFARGGELAPRAQLRTTRRRTELRDGEGRLVADVFEDDVAVRDGRRVTGSFREVEVEIGDATPSELLEALLARLRDAGADASDPASKYIRALGPVDLSPEVVVPDLGEEATVGDVFRRALAASVARLVVHDPVMKLGSDPEGVHQARVATRRLRSDLRTFRAFLDPGRAATLREELGRLAGVLGEVRDADVLLERTRRRSEELPGDHARGASEVIASLAGERDSAHATLLATLRDTRYVLLLDHLVSEARAPALLPEADRRARDVAGSLVRRPWRSLAAHRRQLGKQPTDADLHDLRIRAKRVRYASEAVAPVVGEPAQRLASAAARLQRVLGDLNDSVVAEAWLLGWAAGDGRSPHGGGTARELARLESVDAARLRSEWPRAWKRLSSRELREWM